VWPATSSFVKVLIVTSTSMMMTMKDIEGGARLLQVVRGANELEHDPLERLQDNNCNRSHEDNHLLSHHHLHQSAPTEHRHGISRFVL